MNKFIMMIGIPGSGKSTYAGQIAENEKGIVISSDKLREELFGNVWEIRKNALLFSVMFSRSLMYLKEGRSVVFDATNIRSSERRRTLKRFEPYIKECYFVDTPLEKVLHQNRMRDRNVPEDIIRNMYDRIQEPKIDEGWDKINFIRNS